MWYESKIILNADDFKNVEFRVESEDAKPE